MTTARLPGESQAARDNRNVAELLQELRVAGLGVQVIFGFLLALPFSSRFSALGHAQRGLYVVALTLAAVSTALLLGPVAYHRLVFRHHLKEHLIHAANRMAICGLASVGLTICSAVLLVLSYVAKGLPAVLITIFIVGLFATLWFAVPLYRRRAGPGLIEPDVEATPGAAAQPGTPSPGQAPPGSGDQARPPGAP